MSAKTSDPFPRITVIPEINGLDFPEMWMNVFVTENMQADFAEWFSMAKCMKAGSAMFSDLVVFTGGPDVDPQLYGEPCLKKTVYDPERDKRDIEMYKFCVANGIPMVGICRGAQFLHVMNGGKLFQHVDGHTGDHTMLDTRTNLFINRVSSTHHQMCVQNNRMEILGTVRKSEARERYGMSETGLNADIEAFWYPDTACICFQGHPEFRGYARYSQWCMEQIADKIGTHPHIKAVDVEGAKGKFYRLVKTIELVEEPKKNNKKEGQIKCVD